VKLTTIWTLPASTLRERLRRTRDWVAQKAASALPRRVRYWSTMGDLVKATSGHSGEIPAMTLDEVLRKLPTPANLS
jgi:hypothetical protein